MTHLKPHNQFYLLRQRGYAGLSLQNLMIFFLWAVIGIIALSGCSHTRKTPDPNIVFKPEIIEPGENTGFNTNAPEKNHIALAKQLIDKRYYDIALRQLQTAHREKSNRSAELYYLMGVCHRESERYVQAVACFNAAIDMDKEFSFAYNGLGLTHALTGLNKKALEFFLRAIALNPARADFYNNAGFLVMEQGQYEQAEAFFRKALEIDDNFEQAINNLAVCLGMTGRGDDALEILLKGGPPSAAYSNMGVIYHMQGKNEEADAMFEKAKEMRN